MININSLKLSAILYILLPLVSYGQDILTYGKFIQWVQNYHPVAVQSDISLEFGRQEMRIARGGFDPLLYGDYDHKRYNDTHYYGKREAGILLPTVAGVELKGVFEQNSGAYLNPEQRAPNQGLLAAGAAVNIGQGLFIDSRRASLRQAEIYLKVTEAERQQMLNELYLDATEAYWNWSASYENRKVLNEGLSLAKSRFEAIKESFVLGDLPAIDTVEAYSQVLNIQFRLQSANNSYYNATQYVSTFLWGENQEPLIMLPQTVPQFILDEGVFEMEKETLRALIPHHPELKLADFELASLDVERRWKAEQLKPVLKLNYNFLSTPTGQFEHALFFENNYKWGISFRSPLFLRKERGELGLTKAKLNFKQNDRELKFVQLQARLENEINNFETLENQFGVYSANIEALDRMLQGELTRFEIGESSLFLINAREVSVLDARLIINDLSASRKIAFARMLYAAGLGFGGF